MSNTHDTRTSSETEASTDGASSTTVRNSIKQFQYYFTCSSSLLYDIAYCDSDSTARSAKAKSASTSFDGNANAE